MKWNTIYRIYEGLAVVITLGCWWLYITTQIIDSEVHWQSFNSAVERYVNKACKASVDADSMLKADVRKNGNSREGIERIKRAALLQERTNEVMKALETTKNHLKAMPAGARRKASNWMVSQGEAHRVKEWLDKYVTWLSEEFKDLTLPKFEKIAEGDEENALYFAHNYFAYTSPAEAVTVLSHKQSIVKRYESEVLKKLGAGDITGSFVCYWLRPGVFASTKIIQVGEEYNADMFIEISASRANPRMSINQTPVMVRDGQGQVVFRAQGVGKQFWEGKIRARVYGKDSTFVHRVPLEVLPK
ncbi:hypothetical protein BKI52_28970 [marine bacterium AO1-C]|nr:hypothetical protein BKI52_28970 [marine bacterium AO1-C]